MIPEVGFSPEPESSCAPMGGLPGSQSGIVVAQEWPANGFKQNRLRVRGGKDPPPWDWNWALGRRVPPELGPYHALMGPRRWRVPSERGPDRALTGSGDDEFHRNFALIELAGPRAQLPYAPPRPLPNPAAPCRILLHVCNWKTTFTAERCQYFGSKIDLWTNPCRPKRPFRSRGVARSTRFAREGSRPRGGEFHGDGEFHGTWP